MTRENWGTRLGFILAAVGSAVGLGNIWRFPAVAYENGGGAFMFPYLVALITAGIPLLILEFTIGRKYRGAAPVALRRLHKNAEFAGWWQVAVASVISVYYAVIIAWVAFYTYYAFGQTWGDETEDFFWGDFLGYAGSPDLVDFTEWKFGFGATLVIIWLFTLFVIGSGVRKGIETANRVFIPLLVVMFGVLVIQALTLDGATTGLSAFFTPDWNEITNANVWLAAYGQIFFSLSIGFGIMITYASYLKRKSDITTSALTVGFANSSFELLAGIGVFSALGYMAVANGIPVGEQVTSGITLAFVAFPEIINSLPYLAGLFGVLFFASLTVAGLSSLISIVQVPVAAVQDRFGVSRMAATLWIGGALAVISVVMFPTTNGIILLDATDFFINQFGIVAAALASIVVVIWGAWKWKDLRDDANATSVFKIGTIWLVFLGIITPIMLVIILAVNAYQVLGETGDNAGYSTYQTYGWILAGGALVFGVVMNLILRGRTPATEGQLEESDESVTAGKEDS